MLKRETFAIRVKLFRIHAHMLLGTQIFVRITRTLQKQKVLLPFLCSEN